MLRNFQRILVNDVYNAWNTGAANVMMVSPTGSGKTVILGHILKQMSVASCVIAHRQELLAQLALALNREAVPHSIIAPEAVVRQIVSAEQELHGVAYYDPRAYVRVAGVDTLIRRDPARDKWFSDVQLVVIDEGHHVVKSNKWATALAMFPNARALLPTAHAVRGDGKGLGRHADGVVDVLVVGPTGRDLIDLGLLTDYRIACPPSDVRLDNVHVGASGEFNLAEVRAAVHSSARIVGDVVATYLKFAPGKLGITFAVDIESATDIAREYQSSGVPANVITGETPLAVRTALMQQFRRRQILQLVSVDVLGEGVDVPAVEVISMARPTNSFQLYAQQIGRALRLMISDAHAEAWNDYAPAERLAIIAASPKPRALILDHVQNVIRHGLPDVPRSYSLDRREKRSKSSDAIPLRSCLSCWLTFEAYRTACPHCGAPVPLGARSTPEQVEGDMVMLDDALLAALRIAQAKIDGPVHIPAAAPAAATGQIVHYHMERQRQQQFLRATMALWGGWQARLGYTERESAKRFWFTFGVDVLSAQGLGAREADELRGRIQAVLDKHSIVELAA